MSDGIYIATAGAVAQSAALDVTANNVANAGTTGFRGGRVTFSEALARARSPDMALVTGGTPALDSSPGAVATTGNPLDLALDGDGYFAVDTPDGVRYTRAGAFTLDAEGTLRTATGLAVRSADGGPLQLPPEATQIVVGEDGAIATELGPVGGLALASFAPGALRHDGGNLFVATGAPIAGPPPRVVQGALEGSNVNVVRGVVDLVKVSRTYESLLRMIQGFHDVESRAARELGGPK